MSGWDKSPEYGGPPWRCWDYAWPIAAVLLMAFDIAYCSSQASTSSYEALISAAEIDTSSAQGRR